jgi:hypothetical protein
VRVNARRILKECGILIAITTRDYAFLTGDGAGVGTSGNARRKGGGVLILRR